MTEYSLHFSAIMRSLTSLFSVFIWSAVVSANPHFKLPKRPDVKPYPYDSGTPMPYSPARDAGRYCYVKPGISEDRDDAAAIFDAFHKCNDGGTIIFDRDYLIGSPLDLTFLRHIDVIITGEIHFDASDVYYWAENSFKYDFQNQSVYWKWGGEDVNIYGDLSNEKSVLDGHGQAYWEEIQTNKSVRSCQVLVTPNNTNMVDVAATTDAILLRWHGGRHYVKLAHA